MDSGLIELHLALPKWVQRWAITAKTVLQWELLSPHGTQKRRDRSPNIATAGLYEPGGLDPAQCALLVMDYQPSVLSSMGDADELIVRTNAAIDVVRQHGGHVGFVRFAFDGLESRFVPSTNKAFAAVAGNKSFRNDSPETALHASIRCRPGDIVVRKTRVGAFSTTDLDEQLTNLGITVLILAGVQTSGVVLSTVREAADKDYRLIVLSDCTSDRDRDAHDLLMDRIFPGQAEITTVAALNCGLAEGRTAQQASLSAVPPMRRIGEHPRLVNGEEF